MPPSESELKEFKNFLSEREEHYKSFNKETIIKVIAEIEDMRSVNETFLRDQEKHGTPTGIAFCEGQIAAYKEMEHFFRTECLKQTFSNGKYYD